MQHLSFLVGGRSFAIPSSLVVEVIPPVALTAVAGLPGWIPGCMRYRGGLVPVVDLADRLVAETGTPPSRSPVTPARLGTRVLVVEAASHDDPRSRRLGIRVDAVLDLIPIETLRAPFGASVADTTALEPSWLGPLVVHDGRTIQLLEPRAILPPAVDAQRFPSTVPPSNREDLPAPGSGKKP
jgi:chemotaxis signal transduction protein